MEDNGLRSLEDDTIQRSHRLIEVKTDSCGSDFFSTSNEIFRLAAYLIG